MAGRKFKVLISVISLTIIALLISLLLVVPWAFGGRFISPSFELHYYVGDNMEVVYINGSVVRVGSIAFMVKVTNNYFRPVYLHYNGFEIVLLIYNRSVDKPADVVGNKDFLVWGALVSESLPDWYPVFPFDHKIGTQTTYDYYVARKDLSNFTMELPVAGIGGIFIGDPSITDRIWVGQNYVNGMPVAPDTYYIYCVAFGRASKPSSLTIISVLWE